jgi:hypothetical protein
MMDDVRLSSTPFKTYGTDSSTAQESHEESEDSESEISISGRSSRLSTVSKSSNNTKARGPKKRSPIWNFFDTSGEGKQLKTKCNLTKIVDGKEKKCTYSNKGRNTTNMRLHLNNYHPEQLKHLQSEELKIAEQTLNSSSRSSSVTSFFKSKSFGVPVHKRNPLPQNSTSFQTLKLDLTRLCACTSFPLSMVESEEFQKLIHNLDSRSADSLPCRNTLKKWVVKYSEDIMKKVISNLQLVKNYFLSMDIWSQPGLDKFYLGIVAIYYNHTTEKQEVAALACRDFPHPHTGARIKELFEKIFKEYGLDTRKVIRFTTDKGSNIVKGLQPYTVFQRKPTVPSVDLFEEGAVNNVNDAETDSFVEIELDIEFDEGNESDHSEDDEFDSESDSGLGGMDSNAIETEYSDFLEIEEFYRQAFGKRLSCVAHALNLVFHKILDDKKSSLGKLRKAVLKLLKKINASGVANQQLKLLTGKKLLKVAVTRWNSFYYVLKRVLLLKSAIIDVCRDRLWGIDFDWAEVEKFVAFLKPLATATTYLEGDYPTAAAVIPEILSLQEHFVNAKETDASLRRISDQVLAELQTRFKTIMNVTDDDFDMTCLMCTMLNPSKTLELPGELFDEGKRRLNEFLRTEMNQGLCLVSQMPVPSTSQEGNAAVSPEQVTTSNFSAG